MKKKVYFLACFTAVSLLVFSSCASSRSSTPKNDDACGFRPYKKPPMQAPRNNNNTRPAPGTPIGGNYNN